MRPVRTGLPGRLDRNVTDEGVICHRCRNLWRPPASTEPFILPSPPVHEMPSEFNPPPLAALGHSHLEASPDFGIGPRRPTVEGHTAWWQRHRGKILYVIVAVLVVFGLTALPLDELMAFIFGNEAARGGAILSQGEYLVLLLVQVLCAVLRVLVPLYIGLQVVDALPNDTFGRNLVALGAVAAALAVFGMFSFIPIYGALGFILQLVVITYLYDMDTHPLGKFLLVYLVAAGIMGLVTRVVISGTYGLLAGLGL